MLRDIELIYFKLNLVILVRNPRHADNKPTKLVDKQSIIET